MATKEIIRDPLTLEFVEEVREYAKACELSVATVSDKAVGNSKLISRFDAGGDISYNQRQRVRAYMADNPPEKTHESTAA